MQNYKDFMIAPTKIHDKYIMFNGERKYVEVHQVIELWWWASERLIFHLNILIIVLY